MRRSRLGTIGLMTAVLFLNMCAEVRAMKGNVSAPRLSQSVPSSEPLLLDEQIMPSVVTERIDSPAHLTANVTLSAPYGTTSWDDRDPAPLTFELPLLYLHRQREAAAEKDRTLEIHVAGLPAGAEIQIEAQSRHVDVSTGDWHRISARFVLPDRRCTAENPCTLRWTFDAASTRSDFYDLRVRDRAGSLLWAKDYPDRPDFVMLDTWDVGIGEYTVQVIYATLFPFAMGPHDLRNRLPPAEVTGFIEGVFVPIIRDTWHTQMNDWGLGDPLHPDWDADRTVEVILTDPPFALQGGTGTYTVEAYTNGQAYPQRRLWWFSTNNAFQAYATLADGYRAVFAHEFFHMAQWNVVLSAGCATDKWLNVFIEAQAMFAQSAQYPDTEIANDQVTWSNTGFVDAADHFLTQRLNSSYRDLEADGNNKYDAALYWRFLYEQYNGVAVVRTALEEMACHYDPDIVATMGEVMDRAFQRVGGPFRIFEESLIAFAQANYALRLENGRCGVAELSACGGRYFDPGGIYVNSPLEAWLAYEGTALSFDGAISSSFGMDFIEVALDRAVQGQPLMIRFQGEGNVARFDVEVWKLTQGAAGPRSLTPEPEVLERNRDGDLVYILPQVDRADYDGLALIITRLDSDELVDPQGSYTITLEGRADPS